MDEAIKNILLDKKSTAKVKQNVLLMFANNTTPEQFTQTLNKYTELDPFLVENIKSKLNNTQTHTTTKINKIDLKPPIEYLFYKKTTSFETQPRNEAKRMKIEDENVIEVPNKHVEEDRCIFNLFFMNFSLQCKLCGYRFDATEEGKAKFTLHLENHSRKERALDSAKSVSREYFCSVDEFISSINKLELEVKSKELQYYKADNGVCDVCREKIGVEWNDEMDDWVLVDCVCIDEKEKKFCHRKCII